MKPRRRRRSRAGSSRQCGARGGTGQVGASGLRLLDAASARSGSQAAGAGGGQGPVLAGGGGGSGWGWTGHLLLQPRAAGRYLPGSTTGPGGEGHSRGTRRPDRWPYRMHPTSMLLGLLAALLAGVADFFAALVSRKLGSFLTLL